MNIDSAMMFSTSGTIQRKYQASLDANGIPQISYGGGTYNVLESFCVVPLRLVFALTDIRPSKYNIDDCYGFFAGSSVVNDGDHVNVGYGTFEVDKRRPYYQDGGAVGYESYLKMV